MPKSESFDGKCKTKVREHERKTQSGNTTTVRKHDRTIKCESESDMRLNRSGFINSLGWKKSGRKVVMPRKADSELSSLLDDLSVKYGLVRQNLTKEEYDKRMLYLVHETLEDANYHTPNNNLFAELLGRPDLKGRTNYDTAPKTKSGKIDFDSKEYDEWFNENTIYGKKFEAITSEFEGSNNLVHELNTKAEWEGTKSLDVILDKMRKDGSCKLANGIQTLFYE